jgi:hypothetical protein
MLARVAARSIRLRPTPLQVAFLSQSRTFASNNKTRRPNNYTPPTHSKSSPRHGPDTSNIRHPGGAAASANEGQNRSSTRDGSLGPVEAQIQGDQINPDTVGAQRQDTQVKTPFHDLTKGIPSTIDAELAASARSQQGKVNSDTLGGERQDTEAKIPLHDLTKGIPSTIDAELAASAQGRRGKVDSDTLGAERQDAETKIPLHDLTKGIPSTINAELAEAGTSARTDPNDLTGVSSGGRGDRQMPASAYITSAEQRRNRMYTYMFASMFLFALTGPIYLGRNWETEEEEKKHAIDAPSGWGLKLFYNRVKARLNDTLYYYTEPTFPKLLPNPDPAFERPYTLVLSLEDLLIHSEWTREHGWRMAKRPGVDYFLRYLSIYYELVVFTSVASMNADPVIRKLDPYHIIMWPLYREATRYQNGEYIKVSHPPTPPLSPLHLY